MEPRKEKIQGTITTQYQFCSNNIKPHFEKNHVATWSYNMLPKPQDLTSNHGCEKNYTYAFEYLMCVCLSYLLKRPQKAPTHEASGAVSQGLSF